MSAINCPPFVDERFAKHGIELVGFWSPAEGDEAADYSPIK